MARSELQKYIESNRERGVQDAEIRKALQSESWSESEIEEAFGATEDGNGKQIGDATMNIGDLMSATWEDTRMKLKSWVLAYLLIWLVALGVGFVFVLLLVGGVFAASMMPILGILVFVIAALCMFFFAAWVQYSLIRLVISDAPPKVTAILFEVRWRRVLGLFMVGLLTGIIVLGGFLLLFIPGLIAMVYVMMAGIVYVKEDVTFTEALGRSVYYIKGNFWWTVLRLLVLWGLMFLVQMVLGVASIIPVLGILISLFVGVVIGLFTQVYVYQMYMALLQINLPEKYQPVGWFKWFAIGLVTLGMIVLIGLLVAVGTFLSQIDTNDFRRMLEGDFGQTFMEQGMQDDMNFEEGDMGLMMQGLEGLEDVDAADMETLTTELQSGMQNGIAYAVLQTMLLDYYSNNGQFPDSLEDLPLDELPTNDQFTIPEGMAVDYEVLDNGANFELCTVIMREAQCVTGASLLEK